MSIQPIFCGVGTAMITPFGEDGGIDADAFRALAARQEAGGAAALVTAGTTGEAATLTDGERVELIRLAKEATHGNLPVIAGTGANDTRRAAELSRAAEAAGADALLVITPYCNKTSPRGLIEHYRTVCGATSLPVIAYSVPSRTGMKIPEECWEELFSLPNLVGLKDASGDLAAAGRLISALGREVTVWSGSDELTLPYLSLGAAGVISVVSNVVPDRMAALCRLYAEGKNAEAAEAAAELAPLCAALFCEVNPIPVKAALAMLGLCWEQYRPPLCPPSARTRRLIGASFPGGAVRMKNEE